MNWLTIALVAITLGVAITAGGLLRRHKKLKSKYAEHVRRKEQEAAQCSRTAATARDESARLKTELDKVTKDRSLLQGQIEEIKVKHPVFRKLIYNIGIVGHSGSGKTALALRLVDPTADDIEHLVASRRDLQYDRPVITTSGQSSPSLVEHVFRFHEWGGEFVVNATTDMIAMCQSGTKVEQDGYTVQPGIQALVFVVDLASAQGASGINSPLQHVFDPNRIQHQIRNTFNTHNVPYILNDVVAPHLQSVILFINKADTLQGGPEKTEQQARSHFNDLIDCLRSRKPDLEVIVGSAYTGAGLPKLMSSLVRRILPDVYLVDHLARGQQSDVRGSEQNAVPGVMQSIHSSQISSIDITLRSR